MSGTAGFSLLDEPWIPCLFADGGIDELSLTGVYAEARHVRDITGEVPTQTFAIARLLLAILHRALGEEFESIDDWEALWKQGLPVERVTEYLERHRERFDLLHPTAPFYQVAELRTAKNEVKDITPLLFDVPSNNRLFTARAGSALDDMGLAEAARWLVHAQAYDPSGIKSGMVGDDRVKGGRGYPIGTGWAGAIGGVLIEGADLAETLLLNLVPAPETHWADVPPWERAPDTAAARADETPRGPVDLLTWQSRRIRLVREGDRITGCVLGNGDRITPQNRFDLEAHTVWRFSKPQTQKAKQTTYMPREHQLGRAFWRGISGLIVRSETVRSGADPSPSLPPATIEWLEHLKHKERLPRNQSIAPRAFGVVYGSNNSVVSEIIDDRLQLPIAALDGIADPALTGAVERAVQAADSAVRELKGLAGNLALAAGGPSEGPRERAGEEGFNALDEPFRWWLAELEAERDAEAQLNEWLRTAEKEIRALGTALVEQAGAAAWVGRTVTIGGKSVLMKTNIAEQWFYFGLGRALARLDADEAAAEDGEEAGSARAIDPEEEA